MVGGFSWFVVLLELDEVEPVAGSVVCDCATEAVAVSSAVITNSLKLPFAMVITPCRECVLAGRCYGAPRGRRAGGASMQRM